QLIEGELSVLAARRVDEAGRSCRVEHRFHRACRGNRQSALMRITHGKDYSTSIHQGCDESRWGIVCTQPRTGFVRRREKAKRHPHRKCLASLRRASL